MAAIVQRRLRSLLVGEPMTHWRRLMPLVFGLLAVLSCNTAPKSTIGSIRVPGHLTNRQVEFGILAALADQPPPGELSPELEVTDRALKAWFGWRYDSARGESGRWFLEGRETDRILAGLQRDEYYLRVAIIYTSAEVEFEVVDSRNLRESKHRIHESAVAWIQELEILIRRSLGQLTIGAGGKP